MHAQTGDLWAQPWHLGASLRLFLFFQIAVVFVLPLLGFEKNNIPLYSDIVFSLVLFFGSMIAWENRKLFALTLSLSIAAIVGCDGWCGGDQRNRLRYGLYVWGWRPSL